MKQKTLQVIEEALLWTKSDLEIKRDIAKENLAKVIVEQKTDLEESRQATFNRLTTKLKDTITAYKDFARYKKKIEKERK